VALVLVGVVGPATPGAADDPVAEAGARLDQARADASEAARRVAEVQGQRVRAEAEIATATQSIPWLEAREERLRTAVAERAAALYRSDEPAPVLEFSDPASPIDDARRIELSQAANDLDAAMARELAATVEQLHVAQTTLEARTAELDQLTTQLQQEQAEFDRRVGVAERALVRAIAVGGLRAKGTTPVLGPAALTAEEIAGWFRALGGRVQVAGISIEELAAIYVEEGVAAGVRGDIAFAQSIVETGSFSFIGPNNFAGLGACDSCSTMTTFPTPRDGVRAQMQHLRNYADSSSRSDGIGNPPSPFWYGGDPGTAARNFDGFFAKGWAPTWEEMGGGNWATDPRYAGKVLAVYDRILGYGL
jgi:hypothetical protein